MLWAIVIILMLMIPLLAVVLDSHLGHAIAARLERDSHKADEALGRRIDLLEGEVERLGREVERLEEQSEFLHRLLESKPTSGGALPPGEDGD